MFLEYNKVKVFSLILFQNNTLVNKVNLLKKVREGQVYDVVWYLLPDKMNINFKKSRIDTCFNNLLDKYL